MRDLQYMIDVMCAARDGKRIQWMRYGKESWTNALSCPTETEFCWDWITFDYRVAPESRKAREWWLTPYGSTTMIASELMPHASCNPIHVREVLPE